MYVKKSLVIILCLALTLGFTGCKKLNTTYSSNFSDVEFTSSIEELINSSEQSSIDSTTSQTTTSTQTSSTESTTSTIVVDMEKMYGFNRLTSVETTCLKDIPYGDAQYEVSSVKTDKGYALIYMIDLSCKDKAIKINDKVVTIPYEYRQKNKSVTVTATHRLAGVSIDFTITFDKWDLLFEDEFNGTTLNTDVWNVWDEMRDSGYAYSKDAMFLDGKGNLINRMSILDKPDPKTGEKRITGVITTKDKFETTYGYFEIKMIAHKNTGLMGAFWLNCGDMSDDDAPKDNTAVNGCEIDIVETFYHTKTPAQTIHWDGYGWYQDDNGDWQTVTKTKSLYVPSMENIFDGKYHTFALFWTPSEYIFLIDGEVTNRTDLMGICNQPGYLLISSHFNDKAGEFIGNQTDMIVDYVRVYQNPKYK